METPPQRQQSVCQQQSLALTGRLLFIIIDNLSQYDLADSYLPTLDIISASGLNGIVETEGKKTRKASVPRQHVSHTFGPEEVAWFELMGCDTSEKKIPSFKNLHHGMRAFMATDDERVRSVGREMDMDVLKQPPGLESLSEAAANALTDPDGTHDAGFLFLTTNINPQIDHTETELKMLDGPSRQHQREVDVLENIDQVLGNVVIPALNSSSKAHGIEYTIVVMGDPYRAMELQNIDENTVPFVPFTITSLRSLCDTLEKRDQLPSPTNSPSTVSLAPQENSPPAVSSSRDSIQQFSFPEKEHKNCGLGTFHVSQIWGVINEFFLDHVVCNSSNEMDGEVVPAREQSKRNSVLALERENNAQVSELHRQMV